jgi:hypothetical protein
MWKLTKEYWKDMWNLMWSKTTIDEGVISVAQEIQKRYKLTAKELNDVAKAIKEVGNQIGDIDDAVKGKERKGRKVKMPKPTNMNKK